MPEPRRYSLACLPGHLPDAYVLPFGPADGDASAFARFGIDRPPSIQRSVPVRQAEYLAGRRTAVAALQAAGSDARDLAISPSRAPAWPAGFIGSVTHAAGVAAAVVVRQADMRGLGIDIERVASGSALDAITSSVIDEGERRVLEALAGELGLAAAYTIAFSAKESFFKATAATVGRIFEFSALRLREVSLTERTLIGEVTEPLAAVLPVGATALLGFAPWKDELVVTSCRWD